MRLFDLDLKELPGGTVATVSGEIDLSTVEELGSRLTGALEKRPAILAVDLTKVTFLDSSGLRLLLRVRRAVDGAGGRLVVVPGSPRVARLFELTGADQDLELVSRLPDLGAA